MPVMFIQSETADEIVPIFIVDGEGLSSEAKKLSVGAQNWIETAGFEAKPGTLLQVPSAEGGLEAVLFGKPLIASERFTLLFGRLAAALSAGVYSFNGFPDDYDEDAIDMAYVALAMGAYEFSKYKEPKGRALSFVIEDEARRERVERLTAAISFTRDLVNTPTNDMGPAELAAAAEDLAKSNGATFSAIEGDDLLKENFPLVHMVGRASANAPRLIDMIWGAEDAPKVTLVGKGVCFDTGGLNIKTGNFMTIMKKDMGGAANVLGLAKLIMEAGLNVRLRVLIPAVENAIDGSAFRPGDVVAARNGKFVEIENTDAEGRLVLADALALADEEEPELLIDMATLTGAARVALGPELPPVYCDDDAFCQQLSENGKRFADPVWRMPLWRPYMSMLDSGVADINHAPAGGFGGSITAALFLSSFVEKAKIWAHFDIYAWTPSPKPARPKGGEAQAIRALFGLLEQRYGS